LLVAPSRAGYILTMPLDIAPPRQTGRPFARMLKALTVMLCTVTLASCVSPKADRPATPYDGEIQALRTDLALAQAQQRGFPGLNRRLERREARLRRDIRTLEKRRDALLAQLETSLEADLDQP